MGVALNLIGFRFGRLLVEEEAESAIEPSGRARRRWLCLCQCGTRFTARGTDLRSGRTSSCGCYRNDQVAEALMTHGEAKKGRRSPEYSTWAAIIQRCEGVGAACFPDYGGRGITVCDRWRESYAAFLSDMGRRPSPANSIDRIDNDGNYEPGNCRWATKGEQARNKRSNRFVRYMGREMTLADAAETAGVPRKLVAQRIDRLGWSADRPLGTPAP